jgi:hypothetical protein
MRIESSVTSISWIPSQAVQGSMKLPFEVGLAHYDDPPPDVIEDLGALQASDRFRFANELRAWVDVEDGRIVASGYSGGGRIGSTTIRLASKEVTLEASPFPDLQVDPELGDGWVKFVQTAGGRTGAPAPRRVSHPPFVKIEAPTAWTTLALTIHHDGTMEHELVGASPFPRHWIYDADGRLAAKTGLIEFKHWYRKAFGKHSPWGNEDSPAFATAVETALERELSRTMMRPGASPRLKKLGAGKTLVQQGDEGRELFLLLDGVLAVEVDGNVVAELGPGAVLGERALLEGGTRTSTLRAVTKCRVAIAEPDDIAPEALDELRVGHRKEHEA